MPLVPAPLPTVRRLPAASRLLPSGPRPDAASPARRLECVDPDDEEEDVGDEEDLAVAQPLADEESNFDDFDDEFDDDFEEEENDPDWDHPEESESDDMPPGKGPGRK